MNVALHMEIIAYMDAFQELNVNIFFKSQEPQNSFVNLKRMPPERA